MEPLTVVYWLYRDPSPLVRGPRNYTPAHVNAQLPMLARHCPQPYRVVCITDQTDGLDSSVEVLAPPVTSDGDESQRDRRYPTCFRRLWNFSEAARVLGPRILAGDLDTLYVRDLTPMLERDEDLVVWRAPSGIILGGAYLLRTGTHAHVWDLFDFDQGPKLLDRARLQHSDQGWLNFTLPMSTPAWREVDGAYIPPLGRHYDLPDTARLVSFGGPYKPWMPETRERYEWIQQHYEVPA
jgi:hypothetical protein